MKTRLNCARSNRRASAVARLPFIAITTSLTLFFRKQEDVYIDNGTARAISHLFTSARQQSRPLISLVTVNLCFGRHWMTGTDSRKTIECEMFVRSIDTLIPAKWQVSNPAFEAQQWIMRSSGIDVEFPLFSNSGHRSRSKHGQTKRNYNV